MSSYVLLLLLCCDRQPRISPRIRLDIERPCVSSGHGAHVIGIKVASDLVDELLPTGCDRRKEVRTCEG